MGIRDRLFGALAGQLGGPHGLFGRVVARRLNRFNHDSLVAAVDLLAPPTGGTVADIGFGGGLGLRLLAEAVGSEGVVHGVDPMDTPVAMAAKAHRSLVAEGRLVLHRAGAEALPLDDAVLDGAICCNTAYFWPDLGPPLAEIARVTRAGGTLVLGVADPTYFEGDRPFTEHSFHIRPLDEVGSALVAAGFDPPRDTPVDIGRTTFHLLEARRAG